jgi:hypothetical protein
MRQHAQRDCVRLSGAARLQRVIVRNSTTITNRNLFVEQEFDESIGNITDYSTATEAQLF